jgi:hypothetical protein
MFFKQEQRVPPGIVKGTAQTATKDQSPGMKTLLLFFLMSTIVMIAYLAVPAQPAAEPKPGK